MAMAGISIPTNFGAPRQNRQIALNTVVPSGSNVTNLKGPVPMPVVAMDAPLSAGMMAVGRLDSRIGKSACPGARWKMMVWGLGVSMLAISLNVLAARDSVAGSNMRKGIGNIGPINVVPSWNVTPSRRVNVQVVASSLATHSVANSGSSKPLSSRATSRSESR